MSSIDRPTSYNLMCTPCHFGHEWHSDIKLQPQRSDMVRHAQVDIVSHRLLIDEARRRAVDDVNEMTKSALFPCERQPAAETDDIDTLTLSELSIARVIDYRIRAVQSTRTTRDNKSSGSSVV